MLNEKEVKETRKTFDNYNDTNLSSLTVTLSRLGLDCIDTIEALQQENDIFRADIADANVQMVHRDKMIKQLQAKTLLDVVNSDLVKTYNGSALDKADQYIERLEQENKSLRDKCARLNDFEQSQCAKLLAQNGMYKATLKQAREALSSGLRNLKGRNTGNNQKILVNMRYAIESIDRAVEE